VVGVYGRTVIGAVGSAAQMLCQGARFINQVTLSTYFCTTLGFRAVYVCNREVG